MKTYHQALHIAADYAPNTNKPTEFIKWADDFMGLLDVQD